MDDRSPTRLRNSGFVAVLAVAVAVVIAAATRAQQARQHRDDDASVTHIAAGATAATEPVVARPTYDPARWPTAAAGVPAPPAAVVARGATLYGEHCARCHGANLEGQPDWKRMLPDGSLPAPPHDVTGHTWHHGDGELLRIIGQGGTVYMPNSKMPGFAGTLSEDDRRAVLTFIKTSWGDRELAWQAGVTAGEVGPGAAP